MTHTYPESDRASGAADEGTLRALEFGAIVAQLAELTAFEPARELAMASVPSGDARRAISFGIRVGHRRSRNAWAVPPTGRRNRRRFADRC